MSRLVDKKILLRISKPDGPFWDKASLNETQDILDVVLVDDEAGIFVAKSAKVLLQSVSMFLENVVDVFQKLDLGINWT